MTSTTLSGNSAPVSGGALNGNGVITNCTISGNQAWWTGFGGGICGNPTITNCTISGNQAFNAGGGIYGNPTVINCTISGNSTQYRGGGISGFPTVTNCTISGNSADNAGGAISGGGIIRHSTITGNTANQGGGIFASTTVEITYTILKAGAAGANILNSGGAIYSLGYNLSNDNGAGFLTAVGDQINMDPILGPLQSNGGPTFTHELLPGSPAINAGDPAFTPPPDFDQRGSGFPRVLNGRIDIGSFEAQSVLPALGNYPITSVPLSGNTTVTPDAAPADTARINVSTNSNFKGTFAASPTTGVVTVTDAHPTGTYTVTVTAFGPGGTTTKTFTLAVTAIPCEFNAFTNAADVNTGSHPYSVAIGDFNGDGKQDLAIANFSSDTVSIRLGDGLGGFSSSTDVSGTFGPISVAIGDFNGDGRQDFAVVNNSSNSVSIQLGNGLGSFSESPDVSAGSHPYSVAIGGFNGDGKQDLAVANSDSTVSIRMGNGLGGFAGSTEVSVGSHPYSVAIGDFNGDGKQDLVVANSDSDTVSIRLGDGLGGFSSSTDVGVGSHPYSVAIGDFNGDGKQDLAAANYFSNTVSIRLGDDSGGFTGSSDVIVGSSPYSVATGDFNGDGKQDLAVTNFGSNTVSIHLGDGLGSFGGSYNVIVGVSPISVATGDFNGDGKQDLAVANFGSNTVSILLGQCIPGPTPTATATASATASPPPATARLLNLSTRVRVETGDNVMIGGFIINGAGSLQVVIRGIGPSLGQLGIPDFLPDPVIELRDSSGALIVTNDNWQDDPTQATQLLDLGLAPGNQAESALIWVLQPGAYTVTVAGKNGGTGIALVEVYNVDHTVPPGSIELANISTRGLVQTGGNVMIGGFILTGASGENAQVAVRGIGPSLTPFGVTNALTDPTLELRDGNGALLIANDNWQDDPASAGQLSAHGLAPSDPLESGIFISLQPGLYTAILAGNNAGTGVGLVEIYNVQ